MTEGMMGERDIEWIKGALVEIKDTLKNVVADTSDNTQRITKVESNCEAHGKTREAIRNTLLLITSVASCLAAWGVLK